MHSINPKKDIITKILKIVELCDDQLLNKPRLHDNYYGFEAWLDDEFFEGFYELIEYIRELSNESISKSFHLIIRYAILGTAEEYKPLCDYEIICKENEIVSGFVCIKDKDEWLNV